MVTFLAPPERGTDVGTAARAELSERVAHAGEPFVSFFPPETFKAKLFSAEFTRVHILSPEDPRFSSGYSKEFPSPQTTGIAHAVR